MSNQFSNKKVTSVIPAVIAGPASKLLKLYEEARPLGLIRSPQFALDPDVSILKLEENYLVFNMQEAKDMAYKGRMLTLYVHSVQHVAERGYISIRETKANPVKAKEFSDSLPAGYMSDLYPILNSIIDSPKKRQIDVRILHLYKVDMVEVRSELILSDTLNLRTSADTLDLVDPGAFDSASILMTRSEFASSDLDGLADLPSQKMIEYGEKSSHLLMVIVLNKGDMDQRTKERYPNWQK